MGTQVGIRPPEILELAVSGTGDLGGDDRRIPDSTIRVTNGEHPFEDPKEGRARAHVPTSAPIGLEDIVGHGLTEDPVRSFRRPAPDVGRGGP